MISIHLRGAAARCVLAASALTVLPMAAPSGAVAAPAAPRAALSAGMTRITEVEGISEYALANGLHVLTLPDASKPSTTVNMTIKVGSRMENYGETGMAHLLEHLMFKGTPKHRDPKKEMSERGLSWNGTTSDDRTNYFASMAENPEHLAFYLGWLAESLTQSFIARKDLDSEMTVVRNEMESGENDPGSVLFQNMRAAAFHWHNYANSTIGARADVENVDIARLQAFYRTYYQPDNTVLIVAGKFDEAATLRIIASTFGKIAKPKRLIEPTYTLDPTQDGERTVTLRRSGDSPLVLSMYHVPAGAAPDYAPTVLAASILGGPEFRLQKALVAAHLAAEAFGGSLAMAEPGFAYFGAQLKSDQSIEAARKALEATVEGVAQAPFTADELARAKNIWLRGFTQTLNDPQRVGPGPLRVRGPRRLAARLRPPRPHPGRDPGRRQPRRRGLFPDQQPYRRYLHSEPDARARAGAGAGRCGRPHEGLQGRGGGGRRRRLRRHAGQHRKAHPNRHAARRRQRARGLVAEGDPRGQGRRPHRLAPRRREEPVRQGSDRRRGPRPALPRHRAAGPRGAGSGVREAADLVEHRRRCHPGDAAP